MPDVFISYSRKDKTFVRQLHAGLAALNRDVWVDWEDIPPTADWWNEIREGIEGANTFTCVISPDFVRSDVCRREVECAVASNKRIVPVVCRDLNDEADRPYLHPAIASHNWIFCRESDDFDMGLGQLVQALDTDLGYVHDHTRLLVRAREWESRDRRDGFLLAGEELRRAQTWLNAGRGMQPAPTALHGEYIAASAAFTRRQQARMLAVLMLPLVVAAALVGTFFLPLTGEISTATGETGALDYYAPLIQFAKNVQQFAFIGQAAQVDRSYASQYNAQGSAVIASLNAADAVNDRLESRLGVGDSWNLVKRNWQTLSSTDPINSPDRYQAAYTTFNRDVLALFSKLGVQSNLAIDPGADSWFLANASFDRLPSALRHLGEMEVLGTQTVAGLSGDDAANLRVQVGLVSADLESVESGLAFVKERNPALEADIEFALNRLRSLLNPFLNANQQLAASWRGVSLSDYMTVSAAANDEMLRFYGTVLDKLNGLLNDRLNSLYLRRGISFVFILAVLAVGGYLAFRYYRAGRERGF
jgi:hypothetical protein